MLEAISAKASSLTYASARLRDDDDIARAAVAQDLHHGAWEGGFGVLGV